MTKIKKGKLKATLQRLQQERIKRDKKENSQAQVKTRHGKGTQPKTVHEPVHIWTRPSTGTGTAQPRTTVPFSPHSRILLIGEGNFSFAASLIDLLGPRAARAMVATCLEPSEPLLRHKYPDAPAHLARLRRAGARVLFGIDVTAPNVHRAKGLRGRTFTRIVFNFPHVGAGIKAQDRNVAVNQRLLHAFFRHMAPLLAPQPAGHTWSYRTTMAPVASLPTAAPLFMGKDMGEGMGEGMEKEMGNEMGKGMGKEIGIEMGNDMGNDMEKEMGNDMDKEMEKEVKKDMEKGMGKGMEKEMEKEVKKDMEKEMGKDMDKEMGKDMGKEMEKEMGIDLDNNLYNDMDNDLYTDMDNDMDNDLYNDMDNDMDPSITQPQEAPEIHVTLKTTPPYDLWHPKRIAQHPLPTRAGATSPPRYACKEAFAFRPARYPGYAHRRTLGFQEGLSRDGNAELVGKACKTFVFTLLREAPPRRHADLASDSEDE